MNIDKNYLLSMIKEVKSSLKKEQTGQVQQAQPTQPAANQPVQTQANQNPQNQQQANVNQVATNAELKAFLTSFVKILSNNASRDEFVKILQADLGMPGKK